MPIDGSWRVWTQEELSAWRAGNEAERKYAERLMAHYRAYCRNRLSFFLPHCDGAAFINDRQNDICLLTKGNQWGGTCHGAVFSLMRILKCNPEWMIFRHGVEYHAFAGPKRWLIATSSWETMADAVWPEYQKLLPRYELGVYAPNYGDEELYPKEAETKQIGKDLTFKDGRTKQIELRHSKSVLVFCTYTQAQSAFESRQFDGGHLDEQMPESQFDGFDERGRTRDGWQCCMTLTGHKVKGQPHTGGNSWIHRKLYNGADTKGHTFAKYRLWMDGVPAAILSKESRAKQKEKWITNPRKTHDLKAIREGEARANGGWEMSGGLVLDNWDEQIHMIPRFDIPKDWTLFRALDHGTVRPTACLWGAVTPWGDLVLYREYYQTNLGTPTHCLNIIKMSGNDRVRMEDQNNQEHGFTWATWREVFRTENYFASVLDGHSFASKAPERNCDLGQLYNDMGLSCTQSLNPKTETIVPRIKAWMEYDETRPHIMWRLWRAGVIKEDRYQLWLKERNGNPKGATRFHVFNDLAMFRSEITTWSMKEDSDTPVAENDHLMSCLKYMISCNPCYFGDKWKQPNAFEDEPEKTGSRFTGY